MTAELRSLLRALGAKIRLLDNGSVLITAPTGQRWTVRR